jgi:hypothetical protein
MNFEKFQAQAPSEEASKNEKEVAKWSPREHQRIFVKRSNGDIEGDWTVSQINNEIVTVFKPNPQNLEENLIKRMPLSDLEKINDKENIDFSEATNFDDLYKLINLQGGLKGSSQEYSPDILKEIINKVRNNEIGLNYVTRTNGLRSVVEKLLNNQSKN